MKEPSRFIKFLGGKDSLFALVLLLLIGIIIYVYDKISFVFYPIVIIFSTIAPPIILAFIAYYLLNPIVNLLERIRIKRIWGIIIIILGLSGVLTGIILLTAPAIEAQVIDLIANLPAYLQQMGVGITTWPPNSFLGAYYEEGDNWVVNNWND